MVHQPQSREHRQNFAPRQGPDADRCDSLVGIPTQAVFANQEAATFQFREHFRTDVAIEVIEHHD
ncbi:MAG: hypothetical protein QOJ42_5107 [Acidobacteriaceae bacterium]|nr:hypothetical protein [Acidobacteriaceae bacterium]